jgi:hypothetical protein
MIGIEKIKEYLGAYKSNYVVIGGTACNLNLEEANLQGRTTKDIDMIVVCEAITPEYVRSFWQFIKAGGYELWQVKQQDVTDKKCFYRFVNPQVKSFPVYIELFSRVPDSIEVPQDAHLVHIPTTEYLSSFSAILMDDAYYQYAIQHAKELEGIQVLDKDALIVLKAKAFLNNLARKRSGQQVHQDDIDKHKKDIYRLSYLFVGDERYTLSESLKADLRQFLLAIEENPINTSAIAKYMNLPEVQPTEFTNLLSTIFQL